MLCSYFVIKLWGWLAKGKKRKIDTTSEGNYKNEQNKIKELYCFVYRDIIPSCVKKL